MINFLMTLEDCGRRDFAEHLLDKFAFLYEGLDYDAVGAYRSPFMLLLLRKGHLNVIHGHADVAALKTQVLASKGMIGAISLCAAAVSLSLTP